MSMFTAESAKDIGLDVVRALWPHLTGKGVKILQVEWDMARADHVDAVREVLREIAPEAELRLMSEKEFFATLANPRWFTLFGIPSWNPRPAEWDVECHAYTGSRGLTDIDLCRAQDLRLERDGVLAYAASGNGLADIKGEWHRSLRTMMCGTPTSPAGIFNMGTAYGSQPYPDLVVPTQWTSIAAPAMAACAALVLQAARIEGIGPRFALRMLPRVDMAIAELLGALPVDEPAPPPLTWESRDELVQESALPWEPATAEQARVVIERRRSYEISSTGEIRNEKFYGIDRTERRTVNLPA